MDNTASTIVQDILRDRESGAARLVEECKQPMYEAAMALCGDHAMAEDLVFRTFERVLDRIATCRDESAFTAWMKSILRNEWLMSVRGAAVRNTTPAGLPSEVECMAEPDDGVEAVERSVDAALLRDAIDQLPADMREAILLRYFMGLPLLKTAKILAVPVGTINSRLHYARKALAARLGIAAKKPGVKSLLIALALAAMTAVGAVGVAAIRSVAEPEPEEAEVVLNAKSTEETNGDETNGDSPLQVEAITDNSNTNNEENTMNTQSVKSAAVKVLAAAAISAATVTAANLPAGYTKVEYIQGDGSTGYLVTDFSPDPSNDTIVAEAMLTRFGNNPQFLFESADMTKQDPSPKQGVLLRREGVRFDYGDNGTPSYSAELAATVGRRITYTVKAGRMTWTGGMHIENSDPAPAAWSGPLQILGIRYKGAATFCSSIKLYSLKVFRNNKLIHDYVPVTDDQSRATLYDVCGNSVVERNGTFTAGPAVWLKVEEIPVQPYKSGQESQPRPKAVDLTSGARVPTTRYPGPTTTASAKARSLSPASGPSTASPRRRSSASPHGSRTVTRPWNTRTPPASSLSIPGSARTRRPAPTSGSSCIPAATIRLRLARAMATRTSSLSAGIMPPATISAAMERARRISRGRTATLDQALS